MLITIAIYLIFSFCLASGYFMYIKYRDMQFLSCLIDSIVFSRLASCTNQETQILWKRFTVSLYQILQANLDSNNAKNYAEVILGDGKNQLILTLQKKDGKTPDQLKKELEKELVRAYARIKELEEKARW
jgi:hypothetical protein